MGTPGYLSPEQARGGEADARSDLFALGAILYEALSGRRAFSGATAAETISAILHEDPPPVRTASGPLPGPVERVVRRCLAKEPGDRFHSAHDLAFALEAVLDRPAAAALVGRRRRDDEPVPRPGLFHRGGRGPLLRAGRRGRGALAAHPGPAAPRGDRALGGGQDVRRARGGGGVAPFGLGGGGDDARDLAAADAGAGPGAGASGRCRGAAAARALRRSRGRLRAARALAQGPRGGSRRGGPVRGAVHALPAGRAVAFRRAAGPARQRGGGPRAPLDAGRLPDAVPRARGPRRRSSRS